MLSSSEIDRRKLVEPDIVIAKYTHYHKKDKISTLAQKSAEQFYFGDKFCPNVQHGGPVVILHYQFQS